MKRRYSRHNKIDFLPDSKHYKQLHLILYIFSLGVILLVYTLSAMILSTPATMILTASTSVILGIGLIFKRNRLEKKLIDIIEDNKKKYKKEENQKGLKTTLKKITPKNNKLNIKSKATIKEHINIVKNKFSKKKNQERYIEIK